MTKQSSRKVQKKRIFLRLSSLGDVILSTAALAVSEGRSSQVSNHWLTSTEYRDFFSTHPKIEKLWTFKRKSGTRAWIDLCYQLWNENFDEVIDLHRSLRTRLMRILFLYWDLFDTRSQSFEKKARWTVISKQKFRLMGLYLFKKVWPKEWRPQPWVERFHRASGGDGTGKPDLTHLLSHESAKNCFKALHELLPQAFICIMPSSKWDGKKWPVSHYVEFCEKYPLFPVVLGATSDLESLELINELKARKIAHFSGVGKWNLIETAAVLSRSQGYLGGDTGLAHLAEAVGVPATMMFGPTDPAMGFGPWRKDSQSLSLSLACRPCGKDGRHCYRIHDRYACLRRMSPDWVLSKMQS